MRKLGNLLALLLLATLLGGSTFLDPVDAPRFQVYGSTIIDGQRNATFSAVIGATGTYSGPVSAGNLTTTTATVGSNSNFPTNTGHVFASGNVTIWLPAAAQVPAGRLLVVWNVGSNNVTLAATGSDSLLVFGAASAQASSKHMMMAVSRTFSSWIVLVN